MLNRILGREATPPARARLTVNRISTLMGTLGLAFVLVAAVFIAWNQRRVLFEEGRDHAQESAFFLADHAKRLFEVSDIALHATADHVHGKSWTEVVQSSDVLTGMRELNELLPYVDAILLADETGKVRATTLETVPDNYSIVDRSIFMDAARTPGDRLLIGEAIIGRVTQKPTFLIGRRLDNPDGSFRGLVAVSMSLGYFTDYWRRLDARNDQRVALVRGGSGGILVRYPDTDSPERAVRAGASVVEGSAGRTSFGLIQPTAHEMGAFHQVGDLPAYVAVIYRDAVINAEWVAWLWSFLPFVGAAFAALLIIMLLGRRLARRETAARLEVEAARALLSISNTRLEQRVAERTADLQETNREIQRFAYIVSHDLRAPLVNIMGFTSELEGLRAQLFASPPTEGHPDPAPSASDLRSEFDEALGFIQSSIDKMDRLIKAILTLSRQGQRKFKYEPLDMNLVMRSIVDGVAHRVMQMGATITLGSLPPLVADRIAVEQVFANLVDNALKYGRPGVPVVIEISGAASTTTATFAIKDNGRGIDAKDRERVFELFRRAGRQDQPGEGIGLANVRSLVRRLQGTITLDSTLGLGCVFTITLPTFGSDNGHEE